MFEEEVKFRDRWQRFGRSLLLFYAPFLPLKYGEKDGAISWFTESPHLRASRRLSAICSVQACRTKSVRCVT